MEKDKHRSLPEYRQWLKNGKQIRQWWRHQIDEYNRHHKFK